MSKTIADRCLALAGLFQAVTLVQRFANSQPIDDREIETAIKSLLMLEAQSTAEVYGGVENLRTGLGSVRDRLIGKVPKEDIMITRYALALLQLERKLMRNPAMLNTLREGIEHAQQQTDYFEPTHENVIAALGDLYQRTISTLGSRIMVQGDPDILATSHNQNMIRALLLAGMRSAVLWDQSGGGRWQLVFKRRALADAAASLLETIDKDTLH